MQHALPHLPTQRITAVVAAVAISGALGTAAVVNYTGDDSSSASPPAAAASLEPYGGETPTPYGGETHRVKPPVAGNTPQSAGGARP
jgi:hypothetical protein